MQAIKADREAWQGTLNHGGSRTPITSLPRHDADTDAAHGSFGDAGGHFLPYHVLDFWIALALCHGLLVEEVPGVDDVYSTRTYQARLRCVAQCQVRGKFVCMRAPRFAQDLIWQSCTQTVGIAAALLWRCARHRSVPRQQLHHRACADCSRWVQGPSPDEVAIVDAAKTLGFEYHSRSAGETVIEVLGDRVAFETMYVNEFTSERARMSVVVRCPDGTIKLLVKGSDVKMLPRLREGTDAGLLRRAQVRLRGRTLNLLPQDAHMWQAASPAGHLHIQ